MWLITEKMAFGWEITTAFHNHWLWTGMSRTDWSSLCYRFVITHFAILVFHVYWNSFWRRGPADVKLSLRIVMSQTRHHALWRHSLTDAHLSSQTLHVRTTVTGQNQIQNWRTLWHHRFVVTHYDVIYSSTLIMTSASLPWRQRLTDSHCDVILIFISNHLHFNIIDSLMIIFVKPCDVINWGVHCEYSDVIIYRYFWLTINDKNSFLKNTYFINSAFIIQNTKMRSGIASNHPGVPSNPFFSQ